MVPVLFHFEPAEDRAVLSGEITIDRVEFGVGDGGFLLGNEVTVRVALDLVRASASASLYSRRPRGWLR